MRERPTDFPDATELLAPLTSAADLPNHPSMSFPYKSSTLSDMVQHASEMLHRERKTLWNAKQLLTNLRGDATWIPCGALNTDVDDVIFNTGSIYKEIMESELRRNSTSAKASTLANGEAAAQSYKATASRHSASSLLGETLAEIHRDSGEKVYEVAENNNGKDLAAGPEPGMTVPASIGSVVEKQKQPGLDQDENKIEIKKESLSTADNIPIGSDPSEKRTMVISQPLGSVNDSLRVRSPLAHRDIRERQVGSPDSAEDRPRQGQKQALVDEEASRTLANGEDTAMSDHGVQLNAVAIVKQRSTGADDVTDTSQMAQHRMQTRARAQAKSENTASSRTRSPSVTSWTPSVVHPLFLMPPSACPDRNFGLPPGEAEETRRMVTLYVQKQEEVCRIAEKLYVGLLRANRMRKTVFNWCKAEGHLGEMSDGEDWYDKEEWGLDEDLRKGQDEEEDEKDKEKEGGGAQAKKTRKPRVTALK